MPGTAETVFNLTDKFWCVDAFLSVPKLGVIVALTDIPGKMIGLEFDEEIGTNISCDGAGVMNRCLWVRPETIYTVPEWAIIESELSVQLIKRQEISCNKFNSITIDDDGYVITESRIVAAANTKKTTAPAMKE